MKLVTFTHAGKTRIGKLEGNVVIDLSSACPELPRDMVSLLELGENALTKVRNVAAVEADQIALPDVKLEAPVQRPSKYLAIGMNYQDHVEESARKGIKMPETQIWFNKQVSCVNGPYDPVKMPSMSDMLDYEVELCVVIGKSCKNVSAADAHSVIAGYMVANDYSVRDVQWKSPTWTLGKSFDTHGPVGPYLVTSDEIENPHNLSMRLTVNGEERQNNSTRLMVYNIYQQIEFLTQILTLHPGDLIATGTPMGVAAGMNPPIYLKAGDVVRAEIEKVGHIENRIIPA
ncbi:fumarylacetoacetate hydrolase family protein [Pseudogulbenkiania subflava]|uniref:2-keto-4-pentenoate hydratase/2-oxohepta-3-ene-1,7-dioic acid hydratase (Catechol pathway) n=1 Tax=Pseudogulbenkiania subflava DSM 22618 TaxID=1123014 RepID=A0A1Y6C9C0_9NEIS|nr:fumarylacetoacetate hydrolase family protein [Pseudogulbenkiania subflava]SMF49176.1 2-keto-4-pentenoate hydratase/2-oxohepta-3-ene-1,7-dioic acid hydratase (catechol pathway) [Pseudogulbenkiania subflava DSM 22618]